MKRRSDVSEAAASKKTRKDSSVTQKSFAVQPVDAFRGRLPFYRQPIEVGHFSLDDHRRFHDDKRQLKYFSPPRDINFDLRAGYKDFVKRNEDVKEGLENLLQWVQCHHEKFEIVQSPTSETPPEGKTQLSSLHTDFITWRGLLTKIMCTPYETRESWQMAAVLHNGTIYIMEIETEENKDKRENMEERHKEMCYWGHNFESYVTSLVDKSHHNKNEEKAKESHAINDSEEFVTVIRARLNKHSLVFGAEVDCCTKDNEEAPANYIELKTSLKPHNHHHHYTFKRFKLLKWWAQSYLAGVPKIICGYRDHSGHVKELQTYNTLAIPRLARDEEDLWDSSICLNFLDRFLDWVKTVVIKSGPRVMYMFSWREPFEEVTVTEKSDELHCVLPDWYLKTFTNTASP